VVTGPQYRQHECIPFPAPAEKSTIRYKIQHDSRKFNRRPAKGTVCVHQAFAAARLAFSDSAHYIYP
jgi:hypothetical protein